MNGSNTRHMRACGTGSQIANSTQSGGFMRALKPVGEHGLETCPATRPGSSESVASHRTDRPNCCCRRLRTASGWCGGSLSERFPSPQLGQRQSVPAFQSPVQMTSGRPSLDAVRSAQLEAATQSGPGSEQHLRGNPVRVSPAPGSHSRPDNPVRTGSRCPRLNHQRIERGAGRRDRAAIDAGRRVPQRSA